MAGHSLKLSLFEQYFQKTNEFLDLDLTLERINCAVRDAVGSVAAKTVHIAGTNGKGSTSQFIAELLEKQGFKTLLFTSPHILVITERIRYRLSPVTEDIFNHLFTTALPFIEKYRLTFFEAVFLMAMIYCKEINPDYLILETGLGGRFDATNTDIITDKTPVITSISQDHKEILGSKIADIVAEKAAIVKNNSPVFVGYNPDFIIKLLKDKLHGADLRLPDSGRLDEARCLYPDPYSFNYLNAHNTVEYLMGKWVELEKLPLPPCRQEVFGRIMLDGAHNASGLLSLFKSLETLPDVVILSTTKDRDIRKMCAIVKRYVPAVILTTIPRNPRSVEADQLRKLDHIVIEDPLQALDYAKAEFNGAILVAGSLYLCAYVRSHVLDGLVGANE